jgi:3-methylcrotonyl-CoA carboxylase alpha subunit
MEAKVSEKHIATSAAAGITALSPVAPMPGLVRKILVKKGAVVTEGQPLIVFEAMKLQLTLNAGGDGTVTNVPVREGQLVSEGTELITLTAKKSR